MTIPTPLGALLLLVLFALGGVVQTHTPTAPADRVTAPAPAFAGLEATP